jgi:hypothetical protein
MNEFKIYHIFRALFHSKSLRVKDWRIWGFINLGVFVKLCSSQFWTMSTFCLDDTFQSGELRKTMDELKKSQRNSKKSWTLSLRKMITVLWFPSKFFCLCSPVQGGRNGFRIEAPPRSETCHLRRLGPVLPFRGEWGRYDRNSRWGKQGLFTRVCPFLYDEICHPHKIGRMGSLILERNSLQAQQKYGLLTVARELLALL